MAFVQFSRVSLAFGDRDILDSVSMNLASGTKAALAGANGSGKTTLMKVLSGAVLPDSGERAIQRGTTVSYLPQSGIVHSGRTLVEEAETAFARGYELARRLESLGDELSREDPSSAKSARLVEEHHDVQVSLETLQWHRRTALAEQILTGLGFAKADFSRRVEEFSGGWQMRVALAKILLERPDILLLDEPTNYLDLEARDWLETWLRDFTGGFLVVSHDRYFLDSTCTEVYELFGGSLKRYPGTYTQYEKVRVVELASLVKRYEEQRAEIEKTEALIERFRYKATKAAMVQERIKHLEKMERIELPESIKRIHFTFPPAPHTGRLVLSVAGLTRRYEDRTVIDSLDFVLEKGERLVVVGRNGAGKSTLLRVLAGIDADFTGTIAPGAGVLSGYFSQDNAESLNGTERIIDLLESEAPTHLIPRLRDMLGAFLFRGDDVFKQVCVLSGGEKSRLALLRLLLRPINLLILDEPTNHLDLHSKDVLLDALRDFGGTVVFVSHDRGFIENLATRVLELTADPAGGPSIVRSFSGDYRYYAERIAREAETDSQSATGAVGARTGSGSKFSEASRTDGAAHERRASPAEVREADKKRKSDLRRLEREEERLLSEIALAEELLREQETLLADPAVYSDGSKSRVVQEELGRVTALIEELSGRWEAVSRDMEALA